MLSRLKLPYLINSNIERHTGIVYLNYYNIYVERWTKHTPIKEITKNQKLKVKKPRQQKRKNEKKEYLTLIQRKNTLKKLGRETTPLPSK